MVVVVELVGRSAAKEEPSGCDSVGTSEKRCEGEVRFVEAGVVWAVVVVVEVVEVVVGV